MAIGVTNRNETASPPSSQVREDPIGVETSSFGAETIVSEKTKGVLALCSFAKTPPGRLSAHRPHT